MLEVELLAPARDFEIGTAAIDCGADSVYIAAPKYGARSQAGNSFEDIKNLCSYAHKYRAKIYLTLNTILYDSELGEAEDFMWRAYDAGVDALIVQDLGILKMNRPPIPLFASTQTDIRTPEKAALLESLGFKRLILARELSLKQIREIRSATTCQLETFVHGALCVCYSGQCYLSQYLTGRSANRGECAQPCRANYTLVNEKSDVLVKDFPLLSLKDMDQSENLEALIDAGVTSFKIEGRLKSASYVKNIVKKYDNALNALIEKRRKSGEEICRTSLGESTAPFTPNSSKTFTRGTTVFNIDGKRGDWASGAAAKAKGEYIGEVESVKTNAKGFVTFSYKGDKKINNGDGLCFISKEGEILGQRASSCSGNSVELFTRSSEIQKGDKIYRNYDALFEKELEKPVRRVINLPIDLALSPKGISISCNFLKEPLFFDIEGDTPQNAEKAEDIIRTQMGKSALHFKFTVRKIEGGLRFYKTSSLNAIRNSLAEALSREIVARHDKERTENASTGRAAVAEEWLKSAPGDYRLNCANRLSCSVYKELGVASPAPAFELEQPAGAELMRTKYCIRHQLGLCPNDGVKLYLLNGKNRLALEFDCAKCEMVIKAL